MGPDVGVKLVIVGSGAPDPTVNPFGSVASSPAPLLASGVSAVNELCPSGVPAGIVNVV
jgi:hypothetical protein